jgi:hypothetical protein
MSGGKAARVLPIDTRDPFGERQAAQTAIGADRRAPEARCPRGAEAKDETLEALLDTQVDDLERRIESIIAQDANSATRAKLRRAVPGIGPVSAARLAGWSGRCRCRCRCREQERLAFGSHKRALYLHRAGAANRRTDLDPPPSAERMHGAVQTCRFMRERFTVADLLDLAGWWDDAGVACVLGRVEAACVAAERGR